MSPLSTTLKALIDQNQLSIYAIAKQAGLERTAIHKMISNGRVPSAEYMTKLVNALPVSPTEKTQLMESYRFAKAGPKKYQQRQQVKAMIETMAQLETLAPPKNNLPLPSPAQAQDSTARGHLAVARLVKNILLEAAAQAQDATQTHFTIDFALHHSHGDFYSLLFEILAQHPHIRARQLLTFYKKVDIDANIYGGTHHNLALLSRVLPLVVASPQYRPYYLYNPAAGPSGGQVMPYFIITACNRLVLLNKNLDNAALVSDPHIVAMYRHNFEEAIHQGQDFFTPYQPPPPLEEVTLYWVGDRPPLPLAALAAEVVVLCTATGARLLAGPKNKPLKNGQLHCAHAFKINLPQHSQLAISHTQGLSFFIPSLSLLEELEELEEKAGITKMARGFTTHEPTLVEAFIDFAQNIGDTGLFYPLGENFA